MKTLDEMRQYFADVMAGLTVLANAHAHIVNQFDLRMQRDEAQAHFDARALLLNKRLALLDEGELEIKYGDFAETA